MTVFNNFISLSSQIIAITTVLDETETEIYTTRNNVALIVSLNINQTFSVKSRCCRPLESFEQHKSVHKMFCFGITYVNAIKNDNNCNWNVCFCCFFGCNSLLKHEQFRNAAFFSLFIEDGWKRMILTVTDWNSIEQNVWEELWVAQGRQSNDKEDQIFINAYFWVSTYLTLTAIIIKVILYVYCVWFSSVRKKQNKYEITMITVCVFVYMKLFPQSSVKYVWNSFFLHLTVVFG